MEHFLSQSRLDTEKSAEQGVYDIAIIGGGIHGACLCREAALRGYRVLLLEARDFASGTSSRSSKMLHGGIRYLEAGNLSLVFEALRERRILCELAPHLTRPQEFLFPVIPGRTRSAMEIRIGLFLYDALARISQGLFSARSSSLFPPHGRRAEGDAQSSCLKKLGLQFSALFSYFDGQMDDARIVLEMILDSAARGACVLNGAAVIAVRSASTASGEKIWNLSWSSAVSRAKGESRAKFLVNLAGPWVPEVDALVGKWEEKWPRPIYSKGSHLLFNVPWTGPGLILPTATKGRYYFVWPYFSHGVEATLVGTTDRAIDSCEADPQASTDEVDELLGLVAKDLPNSGLTREACYQTFSGIRILGGSSGAKNKQVSDVSRSECLLEREGYMALLGGKYTSARSTSIKILSRMPRILGSEQLKPGDSLAKLPGAVSLGTEEAAKIQEQFETILLEHCTRVGHQGTPALRAWVEKRARVAVSRYGTHALRVLGETGELNEAETVGLPALRAEVRYALQFERALTQEDILTRRLGLTFSSENLENIQEIVREEIRKNSKYS